MRGRQNDEGMEGEKDTQRGGPGKQTKCDQRSPVKAEMDAKRRVFVLSERLRKTAEKWVYLERGLI